MSTPTEVKAAWLAAAWEAGKISINDLAAAINCDRALSTALPRAGCGLTEGEDFEAATTDLVVQGEIDESDILLVVDRDHAVYLTTSWWPDFAEVAVGHTFVHQADPGNTSSDPAPEFRQPAQNGPTLIRLKEGDEIRIEGFEDMPDHLVVEGDVLCTRFFGKMPLTLSIQGDLCVDTQTAGKLPIATTVGGDLTFLQSLACKGDVAVDRLHIGGDIHLPDPADWRPVFRAGTTVGGRVLDHLGHECGLPVAAVPDYWPLSPGAFDALESIRLFPESRGIHVPAGLDFAAIFGSEAAFLCGHPAASPQAYETKDGTILWVDAEDGTIVVVPAEEWPSWAGWLIDVGGDDGADVSAVVLAVTDWLIRRMPGMTVLDLVALEDFNALVGRGLISEEVATHVHAIAYACATTLGCRLAATNPMLEGYSAREYEDQAIRFIAHGGDPRELRSKFVTVTLADGAAYVHVPEGAILKIEGCMVEKWTPPMPRRAAHQLLAPYLVALANAKSAVSAAEILDRMDVLRANVAPDLPMCGDQGLILKGAYLKWSFWGTPEEAWKIGVVWSSPDGSCVVWNSDEGRWRPDWLKGLFAMYPDGIYCD